MIESARQALAFAKGMENHGCEVHVPDDIDVKAIREKRVHVCLWAGSI